MTVIAAGFDGGAPLPRLTTPARASQTDGFLSSAAATQREAIDLSSSREEVGRPLAPATRAVSFEDAPAGGDADDLDVPDFLK